MLDRTSVPIEPKLEDYPDWFSFYDAWRASPSGQAAHSPKAIAARDELRLQHHAEQLRDARILDHQSNRRGGSINSTVGHS